VKLQKNSSLALFSVLEFAADPARHISAAEIADKYGVSSHHLAKVLAGLARAGIVESVRGVGGGYRFIGNVRRLTLMDVIQTFEQPGLPEGGRREPVELTRVGCGAVRPKLRNRHLRRPPSPQRCRRMECRRAAWLNPSREAGTMAPFPIATIGRRCPQRAHQRYELLTATSLCGRLSLQKRFFPSFGSGQGRIRR
jgi:Rrf2 family protein